MYAVIKAGGKQQKVRAGDVIEVEHVKGDGTIEFQPLLLVDDDGKTHFGKEAEKAVVVAKPVGEQKGDKVKVFKYRAKTGYARRQGHRQRFTLLEIEDIKLSGRRSRKKAEEEPADEPQAESAPAEKSEGKSSGGKRSRPQAESAPEPVEE